MTDTTGPLRIVRAPITRADLVVLAKTQLPHCSDAGEPVTVSSGGRGLAERWGSLTIAEQLAHVGSEVERTLRAHEAGNDARRDLAMVRALELFDLTATDPRWRGPRRREILRAREQFCSALLAEHAPHWPGAECSDVCRGVTPSRALQYPVILALR